MVTRLNRPVRREVVIRKRAYVVTLDDEGLKLTLKGHRKGQQLKWDDLVSGDAALAVALNACLSQANDAPSNGVRPTLKKAVRRKPKPA